MHLNLASPVLLLFSLLPQAYAWGTLGHETVAFVASGFVSPSTEDYFQRILHNTSSSYLAGVATWADSFRYTAAGRFSAPYHFIDAEDNPPLSCGVKYVRDCGEKGCIVAAILNYTRQLLDPELDSVSRNMAAKFIIHFLGDIHQPLHDENLAIGGNGVSVNFSGVVTNLHHVWDTSIPEKLVGGYSLVDAEKWGNNLTEAIKTGVYKAQAADWLEGIDLSDPLTTAMGWAEESNLLICTTVLPDGLDGIKGQELSGEYYDAAVPVVQLQLAKAGYRLAAWLNLLSDGLRSEL